MRNFISNEWPTIFTLIGLTCIALSKLFNPLRFNDFIVIIGNTKYLKLYVKDRKLIDLFSNLLFVNHAMSLSVFMCFGYSVFIETTPFNIDLYLKLLVSVILFILIKRAVEHFIGSLFEVKNIVSSYLFQKTTFKNFSGILLLASNLFLLYADANNKTIIILTLILLVITYALGFMASLSRYQKIIKQNLFYFLLYLCALEIAPYVLILKVITK